MLYLALYRGRKEIKRPFDLLARLSDGLTRLLTGGQYSHCELAIKLKNGRYRCYSSSVRDGGVRVKEMKLPISKWDFIPLPQYSAHQVEAFYQKTKGERYDWWGAIGIVLPIKHKRTKWFCSEWCAAALCLSEPQRFSPVKLGKWLGVGK